MLNVKRWVVFACAMSAFALALAVLNSPVAAGDKGDSNPRVIPLHEKVGGMSYGEWSGAWWRWAYSFPADTNPVSDTTGAFAGLGQTEKVWFLAGTWLSPDPTPIVRTVTIPPDKPLFFPIFNSVWLNLPAYGDNPWSRKQEKYAHCLQG